MPVVEDYPLEGCVHQERSRRRSFAIREQKRSAAPAARGLQVLQRPKFFVFEGFRTVARVRVGVEEQPVVDRAEPAGDTTEGSGTVDVFGPANTKDGLDPGIAFTGGQGGAVAHEPVVAGKGDCDAALADQGRSEVSATMVRSTLESVSDRTGPKRGRSRRSSCWFPACDRPSGPRVFFRKSASSSRYLSWISTLSAFMSTRTTYPEQRSTRESVASVRELGASSPKIIR